MEILVTLRFRFPNLSSLSSAVPQQLLSKIDCIISLAEESRIQTTKVYDLLTLLSKVYKYSHSASQDKLSLCEASASAVDLDKCDAGFKKVPLGRLDDQAKGAPESCEHSAGGY